MSTPNSPGNGSRAPANAPPPPPVMPPYPTANSAPAPPMPPAPSAPLAPNIPTAVPSNPGAQGLARPIAVQPVPLHPLQPVQPMPVQPMPVQPMPVQPMPVQPIAVRPVPVQYVPAQPGALPPAPVRPVPVPVPVPMQGVPPNASAGLPAGAPSRSLQPVRVVPAAAVSPSAAPATAVPTPGPVRPILVQPSPPGAPGAAAASRSPMMPVVVQGSNAATPHPASTQPVPLRREQLSEEEEAELAEKRLIRSAPPWLVSLVVHMVALVVLGLVVLHSNFKQKGLLEVTYAEELGIQLEDPDLHSGLLELTDVQESVLAVDNIAAEDPLAAPSMLTPLSDATTAVTDIEAPTIGMALDGRQKGSKEALLAKYGGTATTEESVRLALEWLKRNQRRDGFWSLTGPYRDGATGENRPAATAMALLAFQGAGHTHKEGAYRKEVERAWTALLDLQDRDGAFASEGVYNHRLYSQAQCTIALCELYGMTKDPQYKKQAQLAVDYAVRIQSRQGGWRYTPGEDADLSVTGWFVMALQSAMMAGLEVPSPKLDRISEYLDSVASDNGTRYSYRREERGPTVVMTAEALLCRQYLNWARNDPRLVDGVEYILQNPIDFDGDKNAYYWYYATQVTHHMEGDYWKQWNKVMREVVPKKQEKTGPESGSWSPDGDRWGQTYAGRLYETCMCVYMLEVYYRHLPIYKWRSTK